MPRSRAIANFERDVQRFAVDKFSPEKLMAQAAAVIRADIAATIGRQRGRSGIAPGVTVTVDGRAGAPIESAKREVRVFLTYLREIAVFGLKVLRDLSPVESGTYRDSHFCMALGQEVEPLQIPANARQFILVNDLPYARKIHTRGARLNGVPPGIYERARKVILSRYGRVVHIDMMFISNMGGAYVLKGQQLSQAARYAKAIAAGGPNVVGGRFYRTNRADLRAGRTLTYPALLVRPLQFA